MKKTLFLAALTATFAFDLSADINPNTIDKYLEKWNSSKFINLWKGFYSSEENERFVQHFNNKLISYENEMNGGYQEFDTAVPESMGRYKYCVLDFSDKNILFYPINEGNKEYYLIRAISKRKEDYGTKRLLSLLEEGVDCVCVCHVKGGKIDSYKYFFNPAISHNKDLEEAAKAKISDFTKYIHTINNTDWSKYYIK